MAFDAEAVRADVRAELGPALELEGAAQKTYLAEKGYTAPHFTAPWGKSADAVSQLVIAGLPDVFPPLKTLEATPNNLPQQPTSFLGRERELDDIGLCRGDVDLIGR